MNDDGDVPIQDDFDAGSIPLNQIKSNNAKERYFQPVEGGKNLEDMERPMSPGAQYCMRDVNFKKIANSAYLSALAGGAPANNFE